MGDTQISARVRADGTGELAVGTSRRNVSAEDAEAARTRIITMVAAEAEQAGKPLPMSAADPDGRRWQVLVYPDGAVTPAVEEEGGEAPGAAEAPPSASEQDSAEPKPVDASDAGHQVAETPGHVLPDEASAVVSAEPKPAPDVPDEAAAADRPSSGPAQSPADPDSSGASESPDVEVSACAPDSASMDSASGSVEPEPAGTGAVAGSPPATPASPPPPAPSSSAPPPPAPQYRRPAPPAPGRPSPERPVPQTGGEPSTAWTAAIAAHNAVRASRVAVLGLGAQAGASTTAIGIGAALAEKHSQGVVVLDTHPHGSLSRRLLSQVPHTMSDLARAGERVDSVAVLRAYLASSPGGLYALSGRGSGVAEFEAAARSVERFTPATVTDCRQDLEDPMVQAALGRSTHCVLVLEPFAEAVAAGESAWRWIASRNRVLAGSTVVAICRRTAKSAVPQGAEERLAAQGVPVVEVPFDRHLQRGGVIDPKRLRRGTREAYAKLGAHLAP